ncbi:MAG: hypothetical protein WA906_03315 [Pacificimonas sp.]
MTIEHPDREPVDLRRLRHLSAFLMFASAVLACFPRALAELHPWLVLAVPIACAASATLGWRYWRTLKSQNIDGGNAR